MNRSIFAASAIAIIILLASCGSSSNPAPPPAKSEAPKTQPPPPTRYTAKLETSKGDITIEVNREWSPRGADRFFELATSGFFDEARFYRVLRGAIAQFGIARDPKLNAHWRELAIPDDPPGKLKNVKGTLAFAKAAANSRSTQIFINLKNNPDLDRNYFVPFARITEGMDVALNFYARYGDTANRGGAGPDPIKAELQGNTYLESQFTQLDFIKRITILDKQ